MNSNSTDPHPDAVKAASALEGSCMNLEWTGDGYSDEGSEIPTLDEAKAASIITAACRLNERDECIRKLVRALNSEVCEHPIEHCSGLEARAESMLAMESAKRFIQ